jgi:hypothetical protein
LPADAHGLGATCKVQGDRVELEAYYDDDTPAQNARVRVEDELRLLVAEGRTNEQGRWSFARPEPGQYRIAVDAGAGHRTTVALVIPGSDTGSAPGSAADSVPTPGQPDRDEFTRFPWLRLGLGIAAIAGVGGIAWVLLRVRRHAAGNRAR